MNSSITKQKLLHCPVFPEVYEQTAVINGMSKAFAMTGWRIGYSLPEWLAKACEKVQDR
jgi:aspartate aminotransferase